MRLDIFLKLSRLVPRRTLAQEMCEAGAVKVNGLRAKSAHEVREGDLLSIRQRGRMTTVRVVKVPSKPPSKREAQALYETISVESYNIDLS
jgi:ribosomal 50S subunit-recycling heat shock protein